MNALSECRSGFSECWYSHISRKSWMLTLSVSYFPTLNGTRDQWYSQVVYYSMTHRGLLQAGPADIPEICRYVDVLLQGGVNVVGVTFRDVVIVIYTGTKHHIANTVYTLQHILDYGCLSENQVSYLSAFFRETGFIFFGNCRRPWVHIWQWRQCTETWPGGGVREVSLYYQTVSYQRIYGILSKQFMAYQFLSSIPCHWNQHNWTMEVLQLPYNWHSWEYLSVVPSHPRVNTSFIAGVIARWCLTLYHCRPHI